LKLTQVQTPTDSCTGPSPRPDDYSYFSEINVVEKSDCKIDVSVNYFNVANADQQTNVRGYNFVLLAKTGSEDSTNPWYVQFNETVEGTRSTDTPTIELQWSPGIINVSDTRTTFRAMMIRKNTAATSVSAGDSIPSGTTCAGPTTGTQRMSLDRAYDSFTAEYVAPFSCATTLDSTQLLFILFVAGAGSLIAILCGTSALARINQSRARRREAEPKSEEVTMSRA
jgi:hypothetical protein